MKLKAVSEIGFAVLLLGMLTLTFSVQPVTANAMIDWWPTFHHDQNHTGYSTSTAPNTNHTIWTYTTGDRVVSSPAVADGAVYVGSDDDKVYCLNASTGTQIWNYTTGSYVESSPAVADGKVYVGSADWKVYCFNASTGAHIWNYTTGGMVVYSSPAVADGKVFVGSGDHKVYCLDALTGAHLWNYTTDEFVYSSPAVADGKVFVGSDDNKTYCLDASTGAHVWNYTTGGDVDSSPAVADGKVYVGSWDGKVYCLDASTGAHVWNYTTGSYVFSSPAVADGKVYVGSYDKKVYAFGTLVWSADSAGTSKATFNSTDNVHVRGEGFTADTDVTIYLLPDGEAALPSNAVANASTITTTTGNLPATLVWSQPLTLGEYDIWVDANQNGAFDGADVWNSQAIGIYTFNVIPEFPTLTSMLLILIMLTVTLATHKRKLLKKPIH